MESPESSHHGILGPTSSGLVESVVAILEKKRRHFFMSLAIYAIIVLCYDNIHRFGRCRGISVASGIPAIDGE